MGLIDNIQFKRAFNYRGTMDGALKAIRETLNPKLMPGEPLICTYVEDSTIKYFLAIGMNDNKVRVFPTFLDQNDFVDFIRKYTGSDLSLQISDESDFTVDTDGEGRYIFKMKDDLLTNFS